MKKILKLTGVILAVLLASCADSPEDSMRRYIAANEEHCNQKDIIITSLTFKPSSEPMYQKVCIDNALSLIKNKVEYDSLLSVFLDSISQETENKRLWHKTMTPQMRHVTDRLEALHNTIINEFKSVINDSRNTARTMSAYYRFNQTFWVTYHLSNSKDEKYHFYELDSLYNVKDKRIVSQTQWQAIKNLFALSDSIHYASDYKGEFVTSLESLGFDIVPDDEDPTKTKEERQEIKRLAIIAEENRKNREIDTQIIADLKTFIKYWNQDVPKCVDDVTIADKASFNSHKITYNYTLIAQKSDYSSYQWEALKETMEANLLDECQNILVYFQNKGRMSTYDIKQAFERIGLSWDYVYRDINGRHLFTINISADKLN